MTTGLILAGHGSHITSETSGLVWNHVDVLRRMGVADEISAAFWKEQPSFHTVLNTFTADNITIVPLFTAQGYFTQTVIPTEMMLRGAITQIGSHTIRYARTLNEHPYLSDIVRQRIEDTAHLLQAPARNIAIAIIGHSTRRNPESRRATEVQVAKIRESGLAAEVYGVYLDDRPGIAEIYRLTHSPYVIAVPYFLALGSHTTIDVPHELGLLTGTQMGRIHERIVYYTKPVGTEEELLNAIIELAQEAGATLREPESGTEWDCFPTIGQEAFIRFVEEQIKLHREACFGDLIFSPQEVRAKGQAQKLQKVLNPESLRRITREKPFRSLATANDLPDGWCIQVDRPEMFHAVAETVYPGAVADWAAQKRHVFQPNTFDSVIARQTGNYHQLTGLETEKQQSVIERICTKCIRHPTWFLGTSPEASIPCPEPCNHWLSAALKEAT